MWYKDSIFYQIYPFGFCGAPVTNDSIQTNRIDKVIEWIPHMQSIGINALYFCPVFESSSHGYDTKDFSKIDCRLGSNDDFAKVCNELHNATIRVVLDAVFNHVGREFFAFRDVQEKREESIYKDWFYINFNRDSNYHDGFYYEGWEGHYNLVRLNLDNPFVVEYLFSSIQGWVNEFNIDGLRLDVAYMLSEDFLRKLRKFCDSLKPNFFLIGEIIHGDYHRIVNKDMLDSCTNYECFKGIYSSINDKNMFEIAYSLNRQFGSENWTLYKGLALFNFVDNHDVTRLASNLKEPQNIMNAYSLLFTMPGIPCIFYGSEWGVKGEKMQGSDATLRPYFQTPITNPTTNWIAKLSSLRKQYQAFTSGSYHQSYLTNQQFVFERRYDLQSIIIAINIDSSTHFATIPMPGKQLDLLTGEIVYSNGTIEIPAFCTKIYMQQ